MAGDEDNYNDVRLTKLEESVANLTTTFAKLIVSSKLHPHDLRHSLLEEKNTIKWLMWKNQMMIMMKIILPRKKRRLVNKRSSNLKERR